MGKELDPKTFVFSPEEVSELTVQSLTEAQKEKNLVYLKTGIPQLDDHYVMHRPSKVNGILAHISHGKTALMNIMARNFVPQLKEGEIIMYCTWEDSVEDLNLSFVANTSLIPIQSLYSGEMGPDEWEKVISNAALRAQTPLWLVGHSDMVERKRSRLTMTDIWHAVDYIENKMHFKVRAIQFDYLQRISRADMRGDIREQFMGIMDSIKDLSLSTGADSTVGSQVSRDVQTRKADQRQPQDTDAQETSNFEQTCDGMMSLWIPKKGLKIGYSLIAKEGKDDTGVFVTENLMMIQTLKQKKGKAPVLRAVDYLPQFNRIETYSPNRK